MKIALFFLNKKLQLTSTEVKMKALFTKPNPATPEDTTPSVQKRHVSVASIVK
jgi:hypothetical protein